MRNWVRSQANFCYVLSHPNTLCVLTYLIHLQPYGVESIIINTSLMRKLRHWETEQCAQGHATLVSGQAGLWTLHPSLLHYVTLGDEWVRHITKACSVHTFPSLHDLTLTHKRRLLLLSFWVQKGGRKVVKHNWYPFLILASNFQTVHFV